ncbi:MAG: hypothetical protein ABI204_05880 [Ginsengibacter sp.]
MVTGTAELYDNGERIEFISACDDYTFDESKLLKIISSYSLVEK